MRLADELLRPPLVTPHVGRGGTAPHRGQWLKTASRSSAVAALKGAETGHGLMLRAIELDGKADELSIGGETIAIGAHGIITARLEGQRVSPSDGLER
jgi:hypothetical protein